MDDPRVAEEARITALRDQRLIARREPMPETKARMKNAAETLKKLAEKENRACKKANGKNQATNIRRLAMSNSRAMEVGVFKEILSNPPTETEPCDDAVANLNETDLPEPGLSGVDPCDANLDALVFDSPNGSSERFWYQRHFQQHSRYAIQQMLVGRLNSKIFTIKKGYVELQLLH